MKDDEREERWTLRQVVFVEDVKSVQLGKVLKVRRENQWGSSLDQMTKI